MNDQEQDRQLSALFAWMREHPLDTSAAEYAFETRLIGRLQAHREIESIWAVLSWRLVPFFAAAVIALTLWHAKVVEETNDAEQSVYAENAEPLDSWNNLN
jgi:hypothetical protein